MKAIQQLLRLYKKDHQVVLLPLGGGGLIKGGVEDQLQELKRISGNIAALIDSEKTTATEPLSADRIAFQEACRRTNVTCHVLDRRALENYWTDRAIKAAKGPGFSALGHYEKLSASPNAWAKSENWRISREMTRSDLAGTDLLELLERL